MYQARTKNTQPAFWLGLAAITIVLSFGIFASQILAAEQTHVNRLGKIQKEGQLRVCQWQDYYAISFNNPKTGMLEGLEVDLAREFASDLGVELSFVATSFADFIEDLKKDRCDIAMFGVGITERRARHVAYSAPHLRSSIYAITTHGNGLVETWDDLDQEGVVIAVQRKTYMEPAMRESLEHAEMILVDRPQEREQEVLSGRADAFMTDFPYGKKMLMSYDWAKLLEPPAPFKPTPYAYAVRQGETAWLARVNDFVAAIKEDGRLQKYGEKHGLLPIIALDE